jgi:distribution and morphology protein 10
MIGHMSGAYAARVTRNLSMCSRFDFNVYSYESEWTMGMEWWMRRSRLKPMLEQEKVPEVGLESPLSLISIAQPAPSKPPNEIIGVVKARASTTTVRFHHLFKGSTWFLTAHRSNRTSP